MYGSLENYLHVASGEIFDNPPPPPAPSHSAFLPVLRLLLLLSTIATL